MVDATQLVLAGAGVCVLALVLIVLARRRRKAPRRTDDHVVEAVEVDEPARLVLARTHDGTQYQGVLAERGEVHTDAAYLVLTGSIVYRRSGGESETMPAAWDRLALPLVDLAEVWTRPARVDDTDDNDQNDKGDDARSDSPSAAQSRWSRHSREQSNAAAPAS